MMKVNGSEKVRKTEDCEEINLNMCSGLVTPNRQIIFERQRRKTIFICAKKSRGLVVSFKIADHFHCRLIGLYLYNLWI